jgi:hypothetical protein
MMEAVKKSVKAAADVILELLSERAQGASICPSEVARALEPEGWRSRMDEAREAALALSVRGKVEITQRGKVVSPPFHGPLRIRLAIGREPSPEAPPTTPDGRYIVVRGRLWRAANPHIEARTRAAWVARLMTARRDVARGLRAGDSDLVADARRRVNEAKVALGERGPVWWSDGAPDQNRRLAKNTGYATWYASLAQAVREDA